MDLEKDFQPQMQSSTEFIRSEVDRSKYVSAALLDLSKAFDSINHKILDEKLDKLVFNTSSRLLIKNFLSHREQQVKIQDILSDPVELTTEVPQVTVLGPLLFNLYINDMHKYLDNETELIQYADDTIVLTSNTSIEYGKKNLEMEIQKLITFFQSNELRFNASKTEFIIFSETKLTTNTQMVIDNVVIDEKEAMKYLGVYVDRLLNFPRRNKTHTKKMATGIKTIYTIRRTIPQDMKKLILNALVLSHIYYSATTIQSINQNLVLTLDRQLNWAVKATFFRNKFDSSRDLKLKHKILPMHYFLKLKRIYYIWKIKTNQLPAFDKSRARELKTWKINKNEKTRLEYWGYKFKSSKLENSLPCLLRNENKKKQKTNL